MRYKFSLALALSVTALSALGISAQSDWDRYEKKSDKEKRKQTVVRSFDRQDEIIVSTPDRVIVRPALRSNSRTVIVRPAAPPVPPVPPVVRSNVRVYTNSYSAPKAPTYSYRSYAGAGDYENGRYIESAYSGNVADVARLNGYRDGVREGAKDARDGDGYNPFGEHAYKDGATGYISKYGNREAYQRYYRQSFVRGYKESFDRYLGNYDRRNW